MDTDRESGGTASGWPLRLQGFPPQSLFLVSAVFHYLGPAFAVLLFARLHVLGVAWLRIAAAAALFAIWRRSRPWRLLARADRRGRVRLVQLGTVLAAMNVLFYLAVARLPLATVGAIEFLGVVGLATAGARTARPGRRAPAPTRCRSGCGRWLACRPTRHTRSST